jgi:butyryl-CoA dehydrogenase
LLLDVLTPVAKTWPSERGIESTSLAIQVLGGYGYSPDYPVERHFRDQRLNPIHEGTTGIQGLDLLGRKVRLHDGAGLRVFVDVIARDIVAAQAEQSLRDETDALAEATKELLHATRKLLAAQLELGPERALAEATAYLDAFGTIAVAWRWLVQARIAAAAQPDDFYAGKLAACRYFFRYELAPAVARLRRLATLDSLIFTVRPEML